MAIRFLNSLALGLPLSASRFHASFQTRASPAPTALTVNVWLYEGNYRSVYACVPNYNRGADPILFPTSHESFTTTDIHSSIARFLVASVWVLRYVFSCQLQSITWPWLICHHSTKPRIFLPAVRLYSGASTYTLYRSSEQSNISTSLVFIELQHLRHILAPLIYSHTHSILPCQNHHHQLFSIISTPSKCVVRI